MWRCEDVVNVKMFLNQANEYGINLSLRRTLVRLALYSASRVDDEKNYANDMLVQKTNR